MTEFSLRAKDLIDFQFRKGRYFATVEFKSTSHGDAALVLITGPGDKQKVALHHCGQIAVSDQVTAQVDVAKYLGGLFDFFEQLGGSDGFALRELTIPARTIALAAGAHLEFHSRMDHFGGGGAPLYRTTQAQFELVMQFGVSKPVKFLAELERVPVTTISRRLAAARNQL